jgi:hypothetical protein
LPALAPRSQKAAHAEIPEQQGHPRQQQKSHQRIMPGSRPKDRPSLPPQPNRHRQREKPKENSRKLQPKHARQSRKRPPHRLPKTLTLALQSLPGLLNLFPDRRSLLRRPSSFRSPSSSRSRSSSRSSPAVRPRRVIPGRRVSSRSRIHRLRHRLGRQTSPNTQYASKPLRIHTRQCSPSPSPIQASLPCIQPASGASQNRETCQVSE